MLGPLWLHHYPVGRLTMVGAHTKGRDINQQKVQQGGWWGLLLNNKLS